jgi:hypothetical protein
VQKITTWRRRGVLWAGDPAGGARLALCLSLALLVGVLGLTFPMLRPVQSSSSSASSSHSSS